MRRSKTDLADAPGQDSFLDIVANLVGILIILVMVIGVHAQDVMLEAAPVEESAAEQEQQEGLQQAVQDATSAARAVETDIHQINAKMKQQEFDLDYRQKERERLLMLVATAEQVLQEKRAGLNGSQQAEYDLQTRIIASRAELQRIQQDIASVETAAPPVTVIEHLPTPMAQTVFGREIHFRLEAGRLLYIPWDELVAQLKKDVPQNIWRLKDRDEFTETLGPFDGFWLKYTMVKVEQSVQTRLGVAVQKGVELDHFLVLPVQHNLGETSDRWSHRASQLQQVLANHPPRSTTITVWTYPDSFNEFRELKNLLFEMGYLTASRPMPAGQPVGGSPRGTKSAAQ